MANIIGELIGRIGTLLGFDGTAFRPVAVDEDGQLQVDVLSGGGSVDAATATNQATMITALQLIDDLRAALGSVNTDDLQVDVKTSALPAGAATSANQTTMVTALQLIDDLRNALGSVDTDDLQVDVKTSALPTGAATETTLNAMLTKMKRLVTCVLDAYHELKSNTNAASGYNLLAGTAVPAGEIWVINEIAVCNNKHACTSIQMNTKDSTHDYTMRSIIGTTTGIWDYYQGYLVMTAGWYIGGHFNGCTAGDAIYLAILGFMVDTS